MSSRSPHCPTLDQSVLQVSSRLLTQTLQDPTKLATRSAQAAERIVSNVAALGHDPAQAEAQARAIFEDNLQQLDAICRLYNLPPLDLKFPYASGSPGGGGAK